MESATDLHTGRIRPQAKRIRRGEPEATPKAFGAEGAIHFRGEFGA
jgi:hypothetical protein